VNDADRTPVVTCFLRNGTDVLLVRRSDPVGAGGARWGGIVGRVDSAAEECGDPNRAPEDAARAAIDAATGLRDACTLVRSGEPVPVRESDRALLVRPVLFDCGVRTAETDAETVERAWLPPTEILDRETVPDLWTSYERVAPTVETVRDDREHGAAYLSVRACEVLRDRAARDARDGTIPRGDLAALARDLCVARPSMPVVANRVNRVMDDASGEPAAVADRASEAIEDALVADERAADRAAEALADAGGVLTLSRSGTVRATVDRVAPDRLYVAESRPGGEGVEVAESLADGPSVTLVPDAAVAHALATEPIDVVLVGADAVLPDGRVVNKVGTRAAALAAARESVPAYAVAARDKVRPDADVDLEPLASGAVYDGDADLDVLAPTFDVTPADDLALVTDDGPLDPEGIAAVAREARERARWDGERGADTGENERGRTPSDGG